MGVGQNAVGAPDLIIDHLGLLLQQRRARVFLVLDDLGQDLLQPLDDGALGLAQGHLVGHLENIAQRLGALAVKAADGQAELVDRLDDRVDLLRQDQARAGAAWR